MVAHRINQAEIEIRADEVAIGRELIERLSLMNRRRTAPVIDRVCTELSGPDRIDRIDRIELDLGLITLDRFDEEFVRKLETAFRTALEKRLFQISSTLRPEERSLELIEAFARTGNLPWWVDTSEPDIITIHINALVRDAPKSFFSLLLDLASDPLALKRIAQYADDAILDTLIAKKSTGSDSATGIDQIRRKLGVTSEISGLPDSTALRIRHAIRIALARCDDNAIAARSMIDETAVDAGSFEGQKDRIGVRQQSLSIDATKLPALIEGLNAKPEVPTRNDSPLEESSLSAADFVEMVERPSVGKTEERKPEQTTIDKPISQTTINAETALPETRSHDRAFEPRAIQLARRRALVELDQLYVEDAGLVILWPFLERFFSRLSLIDEKRGFIHESAQMQAIALLEQLAFEEFDPPEFRVPLAKLLCGLPLEAHFALELPLSPEQLAECDNLLSAIIDHATILRDINIAKFRESFLKRPGALSTRDGTWLLQVERNSYDLVLERFPWVWSWVKLPWMPDPLRVEW